MRLSTLLLTTVSALTLFSSEIQAQDVRNINALHRDGQTFVTWTEVFDPDVRYRVYRDTEPIRGTADLNRAELLEEVDSETSYNLGRSLATDRTHHWVIQDGDEQLGRFRGLYVHTVGEVAPTLAYYAVTSLSPTGVENLAVQRRRNAIDPGVMEHAAPPQAVLQNVDNTGELWAHWVSNRDTPFQRALSLRGSHGFNFRFDPGFSNGPRGLVVRLHSAGETYAQGWPHRNEVQGDVDILALSDLLIDTFWTLWFGYHKDTPHPAANDTVVELFTQHRILWTLDWIQERLGVNHDPDRLYAVGGSMGAMGSIFLAGEIPERLAAVLCRNANFDLAAPDIANPFFVQDLLGRFQQDLRLSDGPFVYDRADASFMVTQDLTQDWPIVRTVNGRQDMTVGWIATRNFYEAMRSAYRPAAHYFDDSEHGPAGFWRPLQDTLLTRTFATRLDRPSLRFSDFSLDEDYGNGDRLNGDPIGAVNGSVDYDPATAIRDGAQVRFDIFLRGGPVLDATNAPLATARLTPRRVGQPSVPPGFFVHYTLSSLDGQEIFDEHLLLSDEFGLVHTPPTPITHARRRATFELIPEPVERRLFLGRAPTSPGELQTVLFGLPGEPYVLGYGTDVVDERPRANKRARVEPFGEDFSERVLGGDALVTLRGTIPASGFLDFQTPIPDLPGLDGYNVFVQARIGPELTPIEQVTIRR